MTLLKVISCFSGGKSKSLDVSLLEQKVATVPTLPEENH